MTVALVVLTFSLFILTDYVLERRRAARAALAAVPARPRMPMPAVAGEPVWVAGYRLPEELSYHRGHTWALPREEGAVVGLDDFARQLLGSATRVELPPVGARLRQGEPAFKVHVDGRSVDLLSPVDGRVSTVNESLVADPSLATREPYGRGWLVEVGARDIVRSLQNLFSGSLARRWIEDARERLELQLVALSGSVLQDGGEPVADFARHLSDEEWHQLTREFLLT